MQKNNHLKAFWKTRSSVFKFVLITNFFLWTLSILFGMAWMILFFLFISLTVFVYHLGSEKLVIQCVLWACKLILMFLSCILVRLFVFEISFVSSESMENSLYKGDIILINKLCYGPLLPASLNEIPWLNLLSAQRTNTMEEASHIRLKGYADVKRNDIVIFRPVGKSDDPYIKRCIGLPGETIEMKGTETYVNGILMPKTLNVKNDFQISFSGSPEDFSDLTSSIGIPYKVEWAERRDTLKRLVISEKQKRAMTKNRSVMKITAVKSLKTDFPVRRLMSGTGLKRNNQDQYFMLGDNRDFSVDSRVWGALPKDHIIGKTSFVLFSIDPVEKKIIWNRTLRSISE